MSDELYVVPDNEKLALEVGNDKKRLRERLNETKSCLHSEYRKMFGLAKFDFENKRLIGENGLYLQWLVRYKPDEPESYENQQTNRGCVVLRQFNDRS